VSTAYDSYVALTCGQLNIAIITIFSETKFVRFTQNHHIYSPFG